VIDSPLEPNLLASRMKAAFERELMGTQRFMTEELQRVTRRFGAAGQVEVSDEKIDDVLLRLRAQGIPKNFRDLRICIQAMGEYVDADDGEAWSPFTDIATFDLLITEIESDERGHTRKRLLAQAALFAYLKVPGVFGNEDSTERMHWRRLAESLRNFAERAPEDDRLGGALKRHKALLDERPAQHFAEKLLTRNDDSVALMASELSIPEDSWFWVALILEQVETLGRLPEDEFQERWSHLLTRALEHESIADRALAGIMDAFASRSKPSRSEAQPLIDAAGERWDNPLVRPDSWLAWVTPATLNVFRPWISERMIDTFFRFLAEDRGVSQERPLFWKRYSEHITEIRILVANDFSPLLNEELRTLRSQMGGSHFRKLEVDGTHVFIMKIGSYQFCEISKHGNAAYFHDTEFVEQLFETPGSIPLGKIKQEVVVPKLRNVMSNPKNRWTHQGSWQKNFISRISALTNKRPRKVGGHR